PAWSARAGPATPRPSRRRPGPPGRRATPRGPRSGHAAARAETPDTGWPHRWSGSTPTAPPAAAETDFRCATTRAGRSRWGTALRSPPRTGWGRVASAASAPAPRRRPGEVAGVGEARHQDHVAGLDLTLGDRAVEVDRYPGAEKVAALFKGVPVAFL